VTGYYRLASLRSLPSHLHAQVLAGLSLQWQIEAKWKARK